MKINIVGAFIRNFPFGTELAFKKGFDRIGGHQITTIDTSFPDQVWDYDADVTIVFKWIEGDYWKDLKRCKGLKVLYQPDDLRFPHIRKMMVDMLEYCNHAFTFDDDGASLALSYGYTSASKLLLTADDDLYRVIPGTIKDIDLTFIGSLTTGESHKSRVEMVRLLRATGFQILAVTDLYNIEKLNQIYNRSKIVLNHATDVGQPFGTGYGYQCRHFEAGLTGACVLSNKILNDSTLKGFYQFSNERELMSTARLLLDNESLRNVAGAALLDEIKRSHLPQHRAAEMIARMETLV